MDRLYAQIRRDFGVVAEALSLHAPVPELLAGSWCVLREVLVVGRVPRVRKEVVAASVSRANDCPFCVEAHSIMLGAAGEGRVARALRKGAPSVGKPELDRYAAWAEATRRPGDPALRDPPFAPPDAPEVLGTAVGFHYINRMTTVFADESPLPRSSRGVLRGPTLWASSRALAPKLRAAPASGASFRFLPADELPRELAWSVPNPVVSGALARWWGGVRRSAERHVPERVSAWSREWLGSWGGGDPPLGCDWLEEATAPCGRERPAARLVLLAALAPHRITEERVAAFRKGRRSDAELVSTVAWGSALAALRISEWLT